MKGGQPNNHFWSQGGEGGQGKDHNIYEQIWGGELGKKTPHFD